MPTPAWVGAEGTTERSRQPQEDAPCRALSSFLVPHEESQGRGRGGEGGRCILGQREGWEPGV